MEQLSFFMNTLYYISSLSV